MNTKYTSEKIDISEKWVGVELHKFILNPERSLFVSKTFIINKVLL